MKYKFLVFSLAFFALTPAFADKMIDSTKGIANLSQALATLPAQTAIPVVFPTEIPKNPTLKQLYAYVDPSQVGKNFYTVDIDSTSACHGAHYCNVGTFQVSTTGQPQNYTDMNNKNLTQVINLSSTQKAYYTPGHAMADYFPPTLEWRDANYFYQLIWQVKDKSALLATAQSIKPYPQQK